MSAEFSAAKLRREVDAQRADEPQTVFVGGDPAALADEIDSRLRQIAPGSPKMSIPPAVLAGWAIVMRSHRCAPVEGSPEASEGGSVAEKVRASVDELRGCVDRLGGRDTSPVAADIAHTADCLIAALRAPSPSPQANEVVSGEEAAELPIGSIVSQWVDGRPVDALTHYYEGWRRSGDSRQNGGEKFGVGSEFVVWWRAPEPAPAPPRPLAVGDTVETAEQLDALPMGTVVRGPQHAVERYPYGWRDTGGWVRPVEQLLPARVLDLGGDS